MRTAIEIGYFLIPVVISITALFSIKRLLKGTVAAQGAPAFGASLAFFVGYALLPDWALLLPKRHWHWLPYLGVLAALVGPLSLSTHKVTLAIRWLALAGVAFVAAWLLVPTTWPRLQPVRMQYFLFLGTYLFIMAALLQPLAKRVPSQMLLAQLVLSAVAVAAAIAAFVSLLYGYVAGVAAASILGCWLMSCFSDQESLSARSLIPDYVILVGGIAFVGYIELAPPLTGLVLLPAAPLALWTCQIGPLSRLRGFKAVVVQTLFVLAGLTSAVLMTAMGQATT